MIAEVIRILDDLNGSSSGGPYRRAELGLRVLYSQR